MVIIFRILFTLLTEHTLVLKKLASAIKRLMKKGLLSPAVISLTSGLGRVPSLTSISQSQYQYQV